MVSIGGLATVGVSLYHTCGKYRRTSYCRGSHYTTPVVSVGGLATVGVSLYHTCGRTSSVEVRSCILNTIEELVCQRQNYDYHQYCIFAYGCTTLIWKWHRVGSGGNNVQQEYCLELFHIYFPHVHRYRD